MQLRGQTKIAHCHSTPNMHAHNSKIRAHYSSKRRRKSTHDVEPIRCARFLHKPLPTDLPATMVVSPLHFHVSWRMRVFPLFHKTSTESRLLRGRFRNLRGKTMASSLLPLSSHRRRDAHSPLASALDRATSLAAIELAAAPPMTTLFESEGATSTWSLACAPSCH